MANDGSNNVTVIDGATNATTTVAAGTPYAVAVNPVTNKIYVANTGGSNVTVIDGATNATTTVAVGTLPSGRGREPGDQPDLRGQLWQRQRHGNRWGHEHHRNGVQRKRPDPSLQP